MQLCTGRCQVSYSFYEIQRHLLEQLITQFSKQVHPSDKTSFFVGSFNDTKISSQCGLNSHLKLQVAAASR